MGGWGEYREPSRPKKGYFSQVASEKNIWYTMMPDSTYPWEPVLVSLSRRGRKIGPYISLWP